MSMTLTVVLCFKRFLGTGLQPKSFTRRFRIERGGILNRLLTIIENGFTHCVNDGTMVHCIKSDCALILNILLYMMVTNCVYRLF